MTQLGLDAIEGSTFDVVICGGGLAGLLLGVQLRRELPQLQVAIIEKTARPLPAGCHKVGESSVEVASQYFERLGLREYLLQQQLVKHGLRFFPGGGKKPLEERFEIGPMQEPIINSYQLDRGTLESDLRDLNLALGTTLLEGCSVREVELSSSGDTHSLVVEASTQLQSCALQTRWFVDATGRHAFLRKRLKLTRGSRHAASAGWYRVKGRVDINDMVPTHVRRWHDKDFASERWRSTNHFMGPGYWAWIIPLSSGLTSIGLVIHEELHAFDNVRTLQGVQNFLVEHEPIMAQALAPYEVLDFLCLRNYSHTVGRAWSDARWALVGEAGAFVDPLYSPGSDFIAYANSFTTELIRVDLAGEDLTTRAREINGVYKALVAGSIDVYAHSAPVYGHPRAMLAKVYWDNLAYWSYPCQFFLRGIYKLSGAAAEPFIPLAQRFVELSNYMQVLLRQWALLAPEEPEPGFVGMPLFPSLLVEAHTALADDMTPEQTLNYMRMRLEQAEQVASELLVRVLSELDAQRGAELYARAGMQIWRIAVDPQRLASDRALSPVARDIERSLGYPRRIASEASLRALLADKLRQPQVDLADRA